jgi:PAS domain S-box-containing protein
MNSGKTILIVDDDKLLRLTTRKALANQGYTLLEAENGQQALSMAREHHPDLILMDVNMPVLDGLETCRMLKSDPELASVFVVIVSGSRVDSDSQAAGLDIGADGYLIRPIPNRELLARVQSMLRIKAAEEALREKETQQRELIHRNVDGMLVLDETGLVLFANPAAGQLFNQASEDLLGQEIGLPLVEREHATLDLRRRDGQPCTVELRASQITWQGKPAWLASLRDITWRTTLQSELDAARHFNTEIVEIMGEGIAIDNPGGYYTFINPAGAKMLGYTPEEIIGRHFSEIMPPDQVQMVKNLNSKRADGYTNRYELLLQRKDGSLLPVQVHGCPRYGKNGEYLGTIGTFTDISQIKNAQEALRQSETLYRGIYEQLPLGYQSLNEEGIIINLNSAWLKMLGYSREEVLGKPFFNFLAEPHRPGFQQRLESLFKQSDQTHHSEFELIHKDGSHRTIEFSGCIGLDEKAQVRQTHCVLNDITERKQMENAILVMSETQSQIAQMDNEADILELVCEKVQSLVQDGITALTLTDASAQSTRIAALRGQDERYEQLMQELGINLAEMTFPLSGMLPEEFAIYQSTRLEKLTGFGLYEVLARQVPQEICQRIEQRLSIRAIYTMSLMWEGFDYGGLVILARQDLAPYHEMIETITSQASVAVRRIRSEQFLKESNEYRENVFASLQDGLSVLDVNGVHVEVNRSFCEMTGLSAQELIGSGPPMSYWPPEEIENIQNAFEKTLQDEATDFELVFMRKNGERFPVIVSPSSIRNANGQIIRYAATVKDISERKRAENAIRESEDKIKSIFRAAPIGIGVVTERILQEVNETLCLMTGYSKEELIGKSARILYPDDKEYEYVGRVKYKQIAEHGTGSVETRFKCKDGRIIDIFLSSTPLNPANLGEGVTFTALDITERKRAEDYLLNFKQIVSSTADGISLLDKEYRYVIVNNAYETFSGKKLEELTGITVAEYLGETVFREQVKPHLDECLNGKTIKYRDWFEYPTLGKRFVEITYFPYVDAKGDISGVVANTRDITEGKKAEIELRESEQRFRALFEQSPDSIFLIGLDGLHYAANQRAADMLGYTVEEVKSLTVMDISTEPEKSDDIMKRLLQGERVNAFERKFRKKNGEIIFTEISVELIRNLEGHPVHFQSIVRDITERKRAQDENLYRQARLEQVIQLGKSITAITDLDQCLRAIHHSISQGLGFERVGLFLYDDHKKTVYGAYGTDSEGQIVNTTWFKESISIHSDWLIAVKSPAGVAFTEDYQTDHNPSPENEMYGVKQHVTLAAWVGNTPVAFLTVDNLISKRPITPADLEALQLFAGYAGLAIQNAQLYQDAQREIEERKRTLQELRTTSEHLQAVLNATPDAILVYDADTGEIIDVNQGMINMTGYARQEALSSSMETLSAGKSPYSQKEAQAWLKKSREEGPQVFEWLARHKDGHLFWVEIALQFAIIGGQGRCVAVAHNISNRKEADAALRASEEFQRALIACSPLALYSMDLEGRVSSWNASAEQMYGWAASEVLGQPIPTVQPEQVPEFKSLLNRTKNGESFVGYETIRQRKDGSLFAVSLSYAPIRDDQAQITGIMASAEDITERKQAEQQVIASEERFRTIFEQAAVGMIQVQLKDRQIHPGQSKILRYCWLFTKRIA